MLRINPNQTALWRDLNSIQIGAGRNRVIFDSLSPAQERFIATLYRGIADKQLPNILDDLGLSKNDGDRLIEALGPLLLCDTPPPKEPLSEDFVVGAFAEIIRASLLNSADGDAVLLQRGLRTVHIDDLSGAGLTLILGLAAAGVGRAVTHDQTLVEQSDLGPNAYPSQLLGKPKIEAVRALLASSPNQMSLIAGHHLTKRNLEAIDCAIIIGHQAIEPKRYVQWLNRDVPHLALTFETDFASVSPLIIPGYRPCLYCLEQERITQDASWPVILSQLVTSKHRLDDATSKLFCTGLAIQKMLTHLDDCGGFKQSGQELVGHRLELRTGSVSEFRWAKNGACSCQLTAG